MNSLNRYFLIAVFFQIGCLALDHSISELEYEDELSILVPGSSFPTDSALSSDESDSGNDVVTFIPKNFDFKKCPVGIPKIGIVRIHNRLKDETLKLISISGNSINFHSSFFVDKVVGHGNSTSFEVVFLSQQMGVFDSVLFIHTSRGTFEYHVRGEGIPNPYRLRPLIGATIPVNSSYEPVITLHNPHDRKLFVLEMLSSGTDFSLKLPDDMSEQELKSAWAIEPFQTKSVMQGSFFGKTEGNHTGFIRIKVNHTAGEYLMVPVEVQVTASPGIYSPQGSLDFGLLVKSDRPKTLSLSLINSENNPVNVQTVTIHGDFNPAVKIEFRPLVIEPDTSTSTVVALVTFDPSQVTSDSHSTGYIDVVTECGKTLSIPFLSSILEGELYYNVSSLGFFVKDDAVQSKKLSIKNTFSSAVAIYAVTVNEPDIIRVESFNGSHVISPGDESSVCTLNVQNRGKLCNPKAKVEITVKSNITSLRLPISCYDGKLQMYSVEDGAVDFGALELYSSTTEYIAVENKNPIEIRLKSWGSNSSWSHVELVGMQAGSMEDLTAIRDFDSLKKSLFLQPGYMAVFSIDVRRPTVEGIFYGEAYVTTDQNQTLRMPFKFMVSRGYVGSEPLFFDKAFPGKVSSEKLHLSSSFNHTLNLLGVRSHPPSSSWFSASGLQEYPEIYPHRRSLVGKVHFDPKTFCQPNCYAGFSLDSHLGQLWTHGTVLDSDTAEVDMNILETLRNRYLKFKDRIISNMALWAETSTTSWFKVKTETRYVWPRLSAQKSVLFPLTSLDNETMMDIVLQNPSAVPVVLQAVLAKDYGPLWSRFVDQSVMEGNTTEGKFAFSWKDIWKDSSRISSGGLVDARKKLEPYLSDTSDTSMDGVFLILPPNGKVSLSFKFSPLSQDLAASAVLLRNNLTGVESVWLKGKAGTGKITVGNGAPGSSLLFQLTENLLQACDKDATKIVSPQVTVRRSFIARNIGEIPIDITSLMVYPLQNSLWSWGAEPSETEDACEGYGYKILNCHSFSLQPNQTHAVDIAFTPDFTLSKVKAVLMLTDSLGGRFNYTLIALVPSNMLSKCSAALPRPWWEWRLKLGLLLGCSLILIAASLICYFEAKSVMSNTVLATIRVLPRRASGEANIEGLEQAQKLDLRAVYEKVDNRFKKHQTENCKSQSIKTQGKPSDSTNGVSNIRNRKGKKTNVDCTAPVQNNCSKPSVDKNQRAGASNNSHLSFTPVQDVVSTYMKKDKESPTNSTVIASNNNNNKKKKGLQQQSVVSLSNGKGKKVSKTEQFQSPVIPQFRKGEEETSSTTTESSNPDEIVSYPEPAEKERKTAYQSLKPTATPPEICRKTSKKEKKVESGSNENISCSSESLSEKSNMEEQKKRAVTHANAKRKDVGEHVQQEKATSGKNYGSAQQVKSDLSLWDVPVSSNAEGLSEIAAQTEAFMLQRPKKNSIGDAQHSQSLLEPKGLNNGFRGQTNTSSFSSGLHASNMANYVTQPQYRNRKPGVIGQKLASSNAPNFGQQSFSTTGLPHSTASQNYIYLLNQFPHNPPPVSRPPCSGVTGSNIWDNEVLPYNGCDAWGYRGFDHQGTSTSYMPQNHASQSVLPNSVQSSITPAQHGHGQVNGFAGIPSTLRLPSLQENEYCFAGSRGQLGRMPSGNSFAENRVSDALFGSNVPRNRALSSDPWDSTFSTGQDDRSGGLVGNRQSPIGTGSRASDHAYLQRMRSDPSLRPLQSQTALPSRTLSTTTWFDSMIAADTSSNKQDKDARTSWPTSTSTSVTGTTRSTMSVYEDWNSAESALGIRSAEAQIWDSSAPISSHWPSSYGTPLYTDSPVDSLAVGSGSRLTQEVRQTDSSNYGTSLQQFRGHSAEITRELEAGLGFNPFVADIWNQDQENVQPSKSWGEFPYSTNN